MGGRVGGWGGWLATLMLSLGFIAQWLERLTADQQVPGSNPGVPSARLTLSTYLLWLFTAACAASGGRWVVACGLHALCACLRARAILRVCAISRACFAACLTCDNDDHDDGDDGDDDDVDDPHCDPHPDSDAESDPDPDPDP